MMKVDAPRESALHPELVLVPWARGVVTRVRVGEGVQLAAAQRGCEKDGHREIQRVRCCPPVVGPGPRRLAGRRADGARHQVGWPHRRRGRGPQRAGCKRWAVRPVEEWKLVMDVIDRDAGRRRWPWSRAQVTGWRCVMLHGWR